MMVVLVLPTVDSRSLQHCFAKWTCRKPRYFRTLGVSLRRCVSVDSNTVINLYQKTTNATFGRQAA